ncbi:hypothetical protein J1N35_025049 [Gossypium stocksii]|uniref:Uncharacterized protein n=1 Tax=Gossypium stocksii TaxID=47602 RepID=A0A9D3ZXA7_9ROSI|nr:hypothetical protein J1N35_025049 [Gossypium stocksii]
MVTIGGPKDRSCLMRMALQHLAGMITAPMGVVEPHDLKVDSRQEIEIEELSEVLGVIEEIFDSYEVSVEELPHFSYVLEETLQEELVEEVLQKRYIQIEVGNSEQVEFVILKLMIPQKVK